MNDKKLAKKRLSFHKSEALNKSSYKKHGPKEKRYFVRDTKLEGFWIRIFPSGTKSYGITTRKGGVGKPKLNTIGRCDLIDFEEAKAKARLYLSAIKIDGESPKDVIKQEARKDLSKNKNRCSKQRHRKDSNTRILLTHFARVNCFFNLEQVKNTCTYDNFKDEKSVENIKKKLVHNYYNDWPQKYIIDRGEWGTPYNYSVMEKYCPNEFKIIFLLRNPIDVIKSYVKLCNDYPDFYINQQYNELDKTSLHRTELEEKIELITKKEDLVYLSFTAYNFLKDKQNVHFVKYEDFVEDPKKIINGIYDFRYT